MVLDWQSGGFNRDLVEPASSRRSSKRSLMGQSVLSWSYNLRWMEFYVLKQRLEQKWSKMVLVITERFPWSDGGEKQKWRIGTENFRRRRGKASAAVSHVRQISSTRVFVFFSKRHVEMTETELHLWLVWRASLEFYVNGSCL